MEMLESFMCQAAVWAKCFFCVFMSSCCMWLGFSNLVIWLGGFFEMKGRLFWNQVLE